MIVDFHSAYVIYFFQKLSKEFIRRNLQKSQIEQLAYRVYLCVKCLEKGKCSYCECKAHDMILEPFSCNKEEKFPNFLSESEWESFKTKNHIVVRNELLL